MKVENDTDPRNINLVIAIDISCLCENVLIKGTNVTMLTEEGNAGKDAWFTGEKFSSEWSITKQRGWYIGRIMSLAMSADQLEKDIQNWKTSIETVGVKKQIMKRRPDGSIAIEDEQ